jgi:hypothetical protein
MGLRPMRCAKSQECNWQIGAHIPNGEHAPLLLKKGLSSKPPTVSEQFVLRETLILMCLEASCCQQNCICSSVGLCEHGVPNCFVSDTPILPGLGSDPCTTTHTTH